jgi:hypothetical protein
VHARQIKTRSHHGEAAGPSTVSASPKAEGQMEETPIISVVTTGALVYTPVAGKSADISVSSMEEGFDEKFGSASRRRCCGVCAVM